MAKLIATAHITNTCGIGIIDIEYGITDKIIYTFLGISGMNRKFEADIESLYDEEREDWDFGFIDELGYTWFMGDLLRTDI